MKIKEEHIPFLLPNDNDTDLDAGRLYMYLYHNVFDVVVFNSTLNKDALYEYLITNYKDAEVLQYNKSIPDEEKQNTDYEEEEHILEELNSDEDLLTYLTIKLEEKIILSIEGRIAKLIFERGKNVDVYLEILNKFKKVSENKKSFNLIVQDRYSGSGYSIKSFDVEDYNIDIESNYNDDFQEINKTICNFLKSNNKNGLILLHGKQGTGKTSYIRYLISNIDKKFIYLPLHMAHTLDSPDFLPFMTRHKDSILIIEDCETILKSREIAEGTSSALVNLLNMGDGLLSDALSLKFICTFNTELSNIDKAILRKGRLKARYEFKDLEKEKVGNLFEKLNIKEKTPKAMSIAEIYNQSDLDFETSESNRKKIGF
jgi:hypothetical protein